MPLVAHFAAGLPDARPTQGAPAEVARRSEWRSTRRRSGRKQRLKPTTVPRRRREVLRAAGPHHQPPLPVCVCMWEAGGRHGGGSLDPASLDVLAAHEGHVVAAVAAVEVGVLALPQAAPARHCAASLGSEERGAGQALGCVGRPGEEPFS